jgi:hypothetical protein
MCDTLNNENTCIPKDKKNEAPPGLEPGQPIPGTGALPLKLWRHLLQ